MTRDEIILAAKCCIADNCGACPFINRGNCITDFMKNVLECIKNEPVLSANSTSSEVSVKEDTDNIQFDDSTKEQICQAYETAYEACTNMLTVYEGMSECEQKAFDIGEAYGKIFSTKCKLERLIGASGREGE